jgi:hypothetical protein
MTGQDPYDDVIFPPPWLSVSVLCLYSLTGSVFSSGEILPEPNEVALSDLTKSCGTNLHLLHGVVL